MNELADELEIAQGNNNVDELIPEAIVMLRQQQAEIEALKAHPVKELAEDLESAKLLILRLNEMLRQQQDFLAMVEHEKNHKRFIFVCGVVTGIVVSCMFFLTFLNY